MGRGQGTGHDPGAPQTRAAAVTPWRLDERIDEAQLRAHLAAFVGGRWRSSQELAFDGGSVRVNFGAPLDGELRNPGWACLSLEWFTAQPARRGHGTKFLAALKDWCDFSGKRLLIAEVVSNPGFWERLDWLETEYTQLPDQFTYHPNLLDAARRRRRERP